MKKSEFVQIKGLDLKELKNKIKNLKQEIANHVLDKNMKKLKDLKMISKKKKEVAQFLTVVKQKQLLAELELQVEKREGQVKKDEPKLGKKEEKVSKEKKEVK